MPAHNSESLAGATDVKKLRLLVLARVFPNTALPGQGLWVERLVRAALPIARPTVISPIAWSPPGLPVPEWRRLRDVPLRDEREGIPVFHPRVIGGLVHSTHAWDARLAFPAIRRAVLASNARERIDLIHAHFIYPDGVVAASLGHELGIPVVTTEHANWSPWLDDAPRVREQVLRALAGIRVVTAVSEATRRGILEFTGNRVGTEWLPNVLDEAAFSEPSGEARVPGRILFVGMVRRVKGLDVLVRALSLLRSIEPCAHLRVIGSTLSPSSRRVDNEVRRLVASMGLARAVEFVELLTPHEVAAEMRRASVLAVPSRRESFSAVTIEALASGTPVVATRCGGPEELLDDGAGRLVPVEDPVALAAGLGEVLRAPGAFDPRALRARVLPRFGIAATTERLRGIYATARR